MLKNKFLYRRSNFSRRQYQYVKTKRNNDIDLFSDLPYHESMKKYGDNYHCHHYDNKPLSDFLDSKIGENWNDVYSEILKKVQHNFKYLLDNDLKYLIRRPIYYDDYIPMDTYRYYRTSICSDRLYIDLNNIICYKSKDEILSESKRIVRKLKLQEIFDNEKESQSYD